MTAPDTPLIFISHYSQEKDVAIQFQKVLKNVFLSCDVFLSSDDESIPLGQNFDGAILEALRRAKVALFLLSPQSVTRPWVHFEIGATWMAGTSMIPICYGGLPFNELPGPIFGRNGINASEPEGLKKLLKTLATTLNVREPEEVPWQPFLTAVQNVEASALEVRAGELASDIARLCCINPDFHDLIRVQPQGGYGVDLPSKRLQPADQEVLDRLEQRGYIEVHPRGGLGETTSYSIFGTQAYSRMYVTQAFAAKLKVARSHQ